MSNRPEPQKYKREYKTEDSYRIFDPNVLPSLLLGTILTHIPSQEDYVIIAIIYPSVPGKNINMTHVNMLRLKTGGIYRREVKQITNQWEEGVFTRSTVPPMSGPTRLVIGQECRLELITKDNTKLEEEPPPKFFEWLNQKR